MKFSHQTSAKEPAKTWDLHWLSMKPFLAAHIAFRVGSCWIPSSAWAFRWRGRCKWSQARSAEKAAVNKRVKNIANRWTSKTRELWTMNPSQHLQSNIPHHPRSHHHPHARPIAGFKHSDKGAGKGTTTPHDSLASWQEKRWNSGEQGRWVEWLDSHCSQQFAIFLGFGFSRVLYPMSFAKPRGHHLHLIASPADSGSPVALRARLLSLVQTAELRRYSAACPKKYSKGSTV